MPAGSIVIADMSTGPLILGCASPPALGEEVLEGIAQALAQDNNGCPAGLWILEACPVPHAAITGRTNVIAAG